MRAPEIASLTGAKNTISSPLTFQQNTFALANNTLHLGDGIDAEAGGGFDRPHLCAAWPTEEVGPMGLEGAVKLGYRDHLAGIRDDAERAAEYQRLVDILYEKGKALNAASQLEFGAVIDPTDTQNVIDRALATAGDCVPSGRYVDGW